VSGWVGGWVFSRIGLDEEEELVRKYLYLYSNLNAVSALKTVLQVRLFSCYKFSALPPM